MITRPMLLDETGQKIKLALQRVKNKFLGTTTDPVTPGQAGSSGVSPVIQDDTGREIISALNDLADAVKPASATEQGLVSTGDQTFAGNKTFKGNVFSTPAGNTEVNVGVNSSGGKIYLFSDPVNSRHGIYSAQGGWVIRIENESVRTYGNWAGTTIPVSKGGTGQTGQTAQQSYTPTVKIGTTAQTVASLSAYYKSWGLMKLIGGRFNLTTTGTGSLIISLPTDFTVPTSSAQPMGILIAPDQKVYHIRVTADGLAAMSNGGSSVAWATGYYCFWAVVMGN